MRILAIETSGRDGSVAALEGESDGAAQLVQRGRGRRDPSGRRKSWLRDCNELLREIGWTPTVDPVGGRRGRAGFVHRICGLA